MAELVKSLIDGKEVQFLSEAQSLYNRTSQSRPVVIKFTVEENKTKTVMATQMNIHTKKQCLSVFLFS